MKNFEIESMMTNFESFINTTPDGIEFRLARDLQKLLWYIKRDNFVDVISKSKIACDSSGYIISDHFSDVGKTINMPKWATKEIQDIMLTRYACYLIARQKLTETEKELSKVIFEQTNSDKNFAMIRSKWDTALFWRTTQDMKEKRQIKWSKPLADFLPTLLLKAKDFATEITIYNATNHNMSTEKQISQEHITNNSSVRETLINRWITPEDVQPQEDIKKLERNLSSEHKNSIKNMQKLK